MNGQNSFKCKFCGSFNSVGSVRNTNKFKKTNYGDIYYNLTISETTPFPKTLYGLKATMNETKKALIMLDKIQTDFNISDWDVQKWRREILAKEYENMDELIEKEKSTKQKFGFTRDEKGNIISPFSVKKKDTFK